MLNRLWAPWRGQYIVKLKQTPKAGCVFCDIFKSKKDQNNFVVERSHHGFSVLNIYPYNNGHLMVVSNRHVDSLTVLSIEEKMDLMDLIERAQRLIDLTIKPDGYNIGINLGKAAGAGFPGHLHIHIVPRWQGDANFMPVVADTKVISQSLKLLWRLLHDAKKKRH